MDTPHIPVLLEEVVRLLNPQPGERYFDGTAGYGGHAAAVIEKTGPDHAILADRDSNAINHLAERFGGTVTLIQSDYAAAAQKLADASEQMDVILLDLGVSSPQLDLAERGFSFREGPLDMRMNQEAGESAADIVNTMGQDDLANLIYEYGEERKSRRIAKAIVENRPFTTTAHLADVVKKAAGFTKDIHPATRTFQALRIAVNDELGQLQIALPILTELLAPGGRIAIISFHSLEDRIVKEFFKRESTDCICPPHQPVCTCDHVATLKLLTKKPVPGTQDAFNPRARSAKLRAAEKLTQKRGPQ